VDYVSDEDGEAILAEPLPEGAIVDAPDAHATVVHALSEPIVQSTVPARNESEDRSTTATPPASPPVPPPVPRPVPVHAVIPTPPPASPNAPSPNPPIATDVPPDPPPLPIAQVAHNRIWVIDDAATKRDINGLIPHRLWYITDATGDRIDGNDFQKIESMKLLDVFLLIFPPDHLAQIINLTNRKLRAGGHEETSKGEIVKFVGVIVLSTRFVFGRRRDIWATASVSRLIDPPNFGVRTRMSPGCFDSLLSCIRFGEQPDKRDPRITSMVHRWMLVENFVTAFNKYRSSNYSPSDRICVNESFSRWYGLGGHLVNYGLPNYVAMDKKPENGCEIQDTCDGRSKVMIQLKRVKGAADNTLLESEDSGGLHGKRVMKQLVQLWENSGRVVVADLYFASVPCALALKDMGLRLVW